MTTARANPNKISDLRQTNPSQTVRSVAALGCKDLLDPADAQELEQVASRFAIAITPAMLDLIEPNVPNDPIARQFVPSTAELDHAATDVSDPIGDDRYSPVAGIVHRYPDRLLLTPLKLCPVYCRFCFRRETVGRQKDGVLSEAQLAQALDYIAEHEEVWEVILSGGDPLLLSPRRLTTIIAALNKIKHVKVIRIHTRVPVVDPERITSKLLNSLHTDKALFVVLHTNHPRELTQQATDACAKLISNGIPMLSQSVLLKGVNDDAATLEQLLRKLVENRIKPYYLHHADRAPGTAHFRTSISEGQHLLRQLRGSVSGLCQPEYVLDIPGGAGKVPLNPAWLEPDGDHGYRVRSYQGHMHKYVEPA